MTTATAPGPFTIAPAFSPFASLEALSKAPSPVATPARPTPAIMDSPRNPLRFLADITNRGDSPEALREDYAKQIRAFFPPWLEDNQTRTIYEWHPKLVIPKTLHEFVEPEFQRQFLATVPDWLAVEGWRVDRGFSGVASIDLETFCSFPEFGVLGSAEQWAGKYPGTAYALGYEQAVGRLLMECKRYAPYAKWTIWAMPWTAPSIDYRPQAARDNRQRLTMRWGGALTRSFGCLNPAMYPWSLTEPMGEWFDSVGYLTRMVRPMGQEAWSDLCAGYPEAILTEEQKIEHNAGGGGMSRYMVSAAHVDQWCSSTQRAQLTGGTVWHPIWDKASYEALKKWLIEVFTPATRPYALHVPPTTAAAAV